MRNTHTYRRAYTIVLPLAALLLVGQGCADKISYSGEGATNTKVKIDKSVIPQTDSKNEYAYDIGYARPVLAPGETTVTLAKERAPLLSGVALAQSQPINKESFSFESKYSLAGMPANSQTPENRISHIQAQINLTGEVTDEFIERMTPEVAAQPKATDLGNWWARVPDQLRAARQAVEQDLNEMRLILETGSDEHFDSLEEKTQKGLDVYVSLLAKIKLELNTKM